jgi:hypothetical protein
MQFEVKIEGLDRLGQSSRRVQTAEQEQGAKEEVPHNGRRIANLLTAGLEEMKRRGLVRDE